MRKNISKILLLLLLCSASHLSAKHGTGQGGNGQYGLSYPDGGVGVEDGRGKWTNSMSNRLTEKEKMEQRKLNRTDSMNDNEDGGFGRNVKKKSRSKAVSEDDRKEIKEIKNDIKKLRKKQKEILREIRKEIREKRKEIKKIYKKCGIKRGSSSNRKKGKKGNNKKHGKNKKGGNKKKSFKKGTMETKPVSPRIDLNRLED